MTKKDFLKIVEQEGDHYKWIHNGVQCYIERNDFLSWCGYINLEDRHTFYNTSYDKINVSVHGGLTFDEHFEGFRRIGFDCNHASDLSLLCFNYPALYRNNNFTYKDKKFVINETNKLADQLGSLGIKYLRKEKLKDILLN